MALKKNVASQKWRVYAFDSTDGSAQSGDAANITGKIALDWAAAGVITDTNPTETEDGYYVFDLTQSETNADNLDIYPESSTANIIVVGSPASQSTVPQYFSVLGIESDGDLTKVNTLDGHTAQTADHVAELAKVPKSDSTVTWNATALASINAEADTALADYDAPTDTEMVAAFTEIKGGTWASGTDTLEHIRNKQTDIEADTDELQTDDIPGVLSAMKGATFSGATDSLEAIRDQGDAAWVTGAGGSAPTVEQVRAEMDSNSTQLAAIVADTNELQVDDVPTLIAALPTAAENRTELDSNSTQLAAIVADTNELQTDDVPTLIAALPTAIENRTEMDSNSTQLAAIVADTNELQADDVPTLIAALNDIAASDILTTALTESYAADGAAPTLAQALFAIQQFLQEKSVAGTVMSVKRLDGTSIGMTFTLDSATAPTSITRAS